MNGKFSTIFLRVDVPGLRADAEGLISEKRGRLYHVLSIRSTINMPKLSSEKYTDQQEKGFIYY